MTAGCAYPARARRGLVALSMAMGLSGLMIMFLLIAGIDHAGARIRGQAGHLAETVAAEGYALHHWLHDERVTARLANPPGAGRAREPSAAERQRLAAHTATTDWRRVSRDPVTQPGDRSRALLPRGWEIVHLIGRAGTGLPDGVIVLRAGNDVVAAPTWDAMRAALDIALGATGGPAEGLATAALATTATPYDATRDRAVLASRSARLDPRAVLRQAHAGHPALPMTIDLDLDGNALENVDRLQADQATIPEISGPCPVPGTCDPLQAETLIATANLTAAADTTLDALGAEDVTLTGTNANIPLVRTADAVITGGVTATALTACANAAADLCGGGDLDLEAASGTPDWTEASIFGDVIIREGNTLTGVRETTATTGVFDTITGSSDLTVRGCFRSVEPFVFGARC